MGLIDLALLWKLSVIVGVVDVYKDTGMIGKCDWYAVVGPLSA